MQDPGLRHYFDPADDLIYLDAATYGLPPRPAIDALQRALTTWQDGTADWVTDWDMEGDVCRALFARLIGATSAEIALLPTVSAGSGLIAASMAPDDVIVVAEDEFTSLLLPFLVAGEQNGSQIRRVPFRQIPEAIDDRTTLVAVSHVRSQDGQVADLEAICDAAVRTGARVLVDATHAAPLVPVAPFLNRIDYLICHGYKHLLCPRGAAFLYVKQEHWDTLAPWFANWRSVAPVYQRSYGGELSLPASAARFDLSLAWHSWAGARPALELLVQWQAMGALDWPIQLANRLAECLGLTPTGSSLVAVRVEDAGAAEQALASAGIKAAARGGNIRLSPHVYNTIEEIDAAVAAIGQVVPLRSARER